MKSAIIQACFLAVNTFFNFLALYKNKSLLLAKNNLKNKVRNQILSNIDGLDEETLVQYEVLVEELDSQINHNPEDIAKMIEMLLSEGDTKLKQG